MALCELILVYIIIPHINAYINPKLHFSQKYLAVNDQQAAIIVKFRINWALSNSLNTYNRHSDWHKLNEV